VNKHARLLTMLALGVLAAAAHAGTVTYVYTDPQGTPLAEADANGNITARFEYTPYGVSVPSMGAAPNGVGYTGHVNDPDTGFVYMQARYYDPAVGRFLSVDPAKVEVGNIFNLNRYGYANNNPIINLDPTGMACGGNGEVSREVQRMRDTSDGCDRSSGSQSDDAGQGDIENCRTMGCSNQALDNGAAAVGQGASDIADVVEEQVTDTVKYWWLGPVGKALNIFGLGAKSAVAVGVVFRTTKDASIAANKLGFRRISETVHGQAVFKSGKLFITRDVDGHNGGAWKVGESVDALRSKVTRLGTYNSDLTVRIGD
jgi:RHS repeat-associated protein